MLSQLIFGSSSYNPTSNHVNTFGENPTRNGEECLAFPIIKPQVARTALRNFVTGVRLIFETHGRASIFDVVPVLLITYSKYRPKSMEHQMLIPYTNQAGSNLQKEYVTVGGSVWMHIREAYKYLSILVGKYALVFWYVTSSYTKMPRNVKLSTNDTQ